MTTRGGARPATRPDDQRLVSRPKRKMNLVIDQDLAEWLDDQPNKSSAVCDLMRATKPDLRRALRLSHGLPGSVVRVYLWHALALPRVSRDSQEHIAGELGMSRETVARAEARLVDEDLIRLRPGRGVEVL